MTLFDTDTMTLWLMGNVTVKSRVDRSGDDEFAITIITRIEILRGRFDSILKASDGEQLRQASDRLRQTEVGLAAFDVAGIDDAAADQFDELRKNKRLKKIGRGDLLIASIALARKALLVTRNLRHFREVPGLRIENWAD